MDTQRPFQPDTLYPMFPAIHRPMYYLFFHGVFVYVALISTMLSFMMGLMAGPKLFGTYGALIGIVLFPAATVGLILLVQWRGLSLRKKEKGFLVLPPNSTLL